MVDSVDPAAQASAKHTTLQDTKKDETQTVELVKSKKAIVSPFIHPVKSWDNTEDFQIPADIQANIVDNL